MVRERGGRRWPLLLLAALVGCGHDEGGVSTPQALTRALASASAGDVVRLRSGEFRGSFQVPPGVTVAGTSGTVLIAHGGAALRLDSGGNVETQVRELTVETSAGDALVGILAVGAGDVRIEGVTVRAASGVGIAADGPARLAITASDVIGTVTDELLAGASSDAFDPADVAVAGLVVVGSGPLTEVVIADLVIRDTAGFGAVFAGVEGEWTGGSVSGVAGTGVLVEASAMRLAEVAIHDVRKSPVLGVLDLAFGLVITAGSQVDTEALQVVRVDGFGVLQDASVSSHVRARAIANEGPAFWIQNAAAPASGADFSLTDAVLQGNGGVGLQLLDIRHAELARTLISDTLGRPAITGSTDFRIISDAVQVSTTGPTASQLVIGDSALFGNGRVGLLLDGESTAASSAGPLSICGSSLIAEEWDCTVDEQANQTCLRQSGPIVGPDWTCSDGLAGLICTTDDPDLGEAEPAATANADDALPDSEGCGASVRRTIDEFGLVPGLGLVEELPEAPLSPLDGPEWECTNEGTTRTCADRHADERIRVDDRDNPSRVDGPGWSCEDTADGRRCTFSGNGLLARAGAADEVTQIELEPQMAERDEVIVAAGTHETPAFGVHTSLPTVCSGAEACVGVAGRGVLGDAVLVGEDGLVSPDGAVEARLGEAGFERR